MCCIFLLTIKLRTNSVPINGFRDGGQILEIRDCPLKSRTSANHAMSTDTTQTKINTNSFLKIKRTMTKNKVKLHLFLPKVKNNINFWTNQELIQITNYLQLVWSKYIFASFNQLVLFHWFKYGGTTFTAMTSGKWENCDQISFHINHYDILHICSKARLKYFDQLNKLRFITDYSFCLKYSWHWNDTIIYRNDSWLEQFFALFHKTYLNKL